MPVTRIAAAQKAALLAGTATSHTVETVAAVNPQAGPYVYGLAFYGWAGGVSVVGDPIGCTWASDTVVPLLASPLLFGSDKNLLMGWIVKNPHSGQVQASHSGIGVNALDTRGRFLTAGVWAQAQELDLDNIASLVVSAVGSASVAAQSITVPSILPASRVLAAHFVAGGKRITDYNGMKVATAGSGDKGQMILGECRGADSVVSTAKHSASTGLWAAIGLNLNPAPVILGAKGTHKAGKGAFGGSVYRFAEPHPDRFYEVPKIGSADPAVLAGNFERSADGVLMPVYVKDPDDTNDYTLDWKNHLADDDHITHVEHTVTGSLRRFSQSLDDAGRRTQVWINGGTVNVTRGVQVRCTTAKGRRFDRTFWIVGSQG